MPVDYLLTSWHDGLWMHQIHSYSESLFLLTHVRKHEKLRSTPQHDNMNMFKSIDTCSKIPTKRYKVYKELYFLFFHGFSFQNNPFEELLELGVLQQTQNHEAIAAPVFVRMLSELSAVIGRGGDIQEVLGKKPTPIFCTFWWWFLGELFGVLWDPLHLKNHFGTGLLN